MKNTLLSAFLLFTVSFPVISNADDSTVDCGSTCPTGEVLVSFADGNNVQCSCMQSATMDPTVRDPNIVDGTVVVDQ